MLLKLLKRAMQLSQRIRSDALGVAMKSIRQASDGMFPPGSGAA